MGLGSWLERRRRTKRLFHVFVLMGAMLASTGCAPNIQTPAAQQDRREAAFLQKQMENSVSYSGKVDAAKLASIRKQLKERIRNLELQDAGAAVGSAVGNIYTYAGRPPTKGEEIGNLIGQGINAYGQYQLGKRIALLKELDEIIGRIYDFDVVSEYDQRIIDVAQFQQMKQYIADLTQRVGSSRWEELITKERSNAEFVRTVRELRKAMAEEVLIDAQRLGSIVAQKGSERQQQEWTSFMQQTQHTLEVFR